MRAIRRYLTYANVVLTLLAFVVLCGGTALALSKNSVGRKQLRKNAVTTKKIKNGAVTAAKLAASSVKGASIDTGSLKLTVFQQSVPTIPATLGAVGGGTASCPAGAKAVAGGGLSDPSHNGGFIEDSRPVTGTTGGPGPGGTFTGWRVVWNNSQTITLNPTVYVVCLG
jgi:hypothetical protein